MWSILFYYGNSSSVHFRHIVLNYISSGLHNDSFILPFKFELLYSFKCWLMELYDTSNFHHKRTFHTLRFDIDIWLRFVSLLHLFYIWNPSDAELYPWWRISLDIDSGVTSLHLNRIPSPHLSARKPFCVVFTLRCYGHMNTFAIYLWDMFNTETRRLISVLFSETLY